MRAGERLSTSDSIMAIARAQPAEKRGADGRGAEASELMSTARAGLQETPSSRRVLLLTQNLALCGAQRQIVELAHGLDRKGYDVRVGALEPEGPLVGDLDAARIPLIPFRRRWRWDLGVIPALVRYLRGEKIDVLHSFLFLPNFYSRLAGRIAGTPAVVSSLRSTGIEGWHRYFLDRRTCLLCDVLIANSQAGRDDYVRRGGPARRIVVVPNGVNEERLSRTGRLEAMRQEWDLDRFDEVIGMVAAMELRKDHRLLLTAMKEILRRRPRTGLLLVGDGSLRGGLEYLARAQNMASNVVFAGEVRRSEGVYPLLDVYVQASRSEEGMSNSILEAMSNSLPVVATDVGGNREVVEDRVSGFVVDAGDPRAMAEAIIALLEDPLKRRELGAAGLRRVRGRFSLERMITSTRDVYEGLLARTDGTRRSHRGPSREGATGDSVRP